MAWGCPLDDSEILLTPFYLYYFTYAETMRAQSTRTKISDTDNQPQQSLKFRFGI
jgi:hypothetical protein